MTSIEQELARRKIYQSMLEQSMQQDQQQVVSGRVVPYSPMQGISKLVQAYMAKKGMDKSFDAEKESNRLSNQGISDALNTANGFTRPELGIEGMDSEYQPAQQVAGNKDAAMQDMIRNPNIAQAAKDKIAESMLAKQFPQGGGYTTVHKMTKDGVPGTLVLDGRTGAEVSWSPGLIDTTQDADNRAKIKTKEEQAKANIALGTKPAIAENIARQTKVGEGAGLEATQDQIAESKRREEEAKAVGKYTGEVKAKADISGGKFDGYYEEAMSLLNKNPTESGLGAAFDAAGAFVGYSPKGAATQDSLKVMAANLTGLVPRFEGPQSDKDTALYKEAAAQIGSNIPVERRKAALETMKRVMERNKEAGTFKGFDSGDSKAFMDDLDKLLGIN